jgi:hypothetical protein
MNAIQRAGGEEDIVAAVRKLTTEKMRFAAAAAALAKITVEEMADIIRGNDPDYYFKLQAALADIDQWTGDIRDEPTVQPRHDEAPSTVSQPVGLAPTSAALELLKKLNNLFDILARAAADIRVLSGVYTDQYYQRQILLSRSSSAVVAENRRAKFFRAMKDFNKDTRAIERAETLDLPANSYRLFLLDHPAMNDFVLFVISKLKGDSMNAKRSFPSGMSGPNAGDGSVGGVADVIEQYKDEALGSSYGFTGIPGMQGMLTRMHLAKIWPEIAESAAIVTIDQRSAIETRIEQLIGGEIILTDGLSNLVLERYNTIRVLGDGAVPRDVVSVNDAAPADADGAMAFRRTLDGVNYHQMGLRANMMASPDGPTQQGETAAAVLRQFTKTGPSNRPGVYYEIMGCPEPSRQILNKVAEYELLPEKDFGLERKKLIDMLLAVKESGPSSAKESASGGPGHIRWPDRDAIRWPDRDAIREVTIKFVEWGADRRTESVPKSAIAVLSHKLSNIVDIDRISKDLNLEIDKQYTKYPLDTANYAGAALAKLIADHDRFVITKSVDSPEVKLWESRPSLRAFVGV